MKKIEALELEATYLEDKRTENTTRPRWRLKKDAEDAMRLSSLVLFSGQVVKNRTGRITSDLESMLTNW